MDLTDEQKHFVGPPIVAGANAARAFDAPVRYPLLFTRWGSPELSTALRLSSFSSFLVMIEHIIGVLVIAPFMFFFRGFGHLREVTATFERRDWVAALMVSLGSGLGLYFFLIALAMGNPTVAILLQKSQPLITLFVAMLVLKERPKKRFYMALAVALLGIFLLSFNDIKNAELFGLTAVVCSLIAAGFWGSNTVFGRLLTDKVDYWDLTFFRYIGGAGVLIVFNLLIFAFTPDNINALTETFTTFPNVFGGFEMTGLMIIIYAAILTGGILPLALYYYGLRWSKASVGGLAELAFPLLAVFVNWITLGYFLTDVQILGTIILLLAVTALTYINAKEYEEEKAGKSIESVDDAMQVLEET